MNGGSLPASIKCTSALRRVPPLQAISIPIGMRQRGRCLRFRIAAARVTDCDGVSHWPHDDKSPRAMSFLERPGTVQQGGGLLASIPDGGLAPGNYYWVLSDSG